jgi:F-type H+-transporting ATPase subunit b
MNFKKFIKLTIPYWFFSFSIKAAEGMPQFNAKSYPSQLFWLVLTFATLYIIVSLVLLPRIRENIRLRKNKVLNNIERAESIKLEIEKMIRGYDLKVAEAKETARNMVKKSVLKYNNDYNIQVEEVKSQIEAKQKIVATSLINYKAEIEKTMSDTIASVSVQLINKLINKKVTTGDIKLLLNESNSIDKI